MTAITTIGDLIDNGYTLSAVCNAQMCWHSARLDLGTFAKTLGRDYAVIANPAFVGRLRCSRCGSADVGIRISPPNAPKHD